MEKSEVCVHFKEYIGMCDQFGKGCPERKSKIKVNAECKKNGAVCQRKNLGFRTLLTSHIEGDYRA